MNKKVEEVYNRDAIIYRYWNNNRIETPFGREIKLSERSLVISYIIQSATSDLLLTQATKINKKLKGRKSFISFMIHDNIVIDLAKEDIPLMKEVRTVFAETPFGKYLINTALGKNFGEMRSFV